MGEIYESQPFLMALSNKLESIKAIHSADPASPPFTRPPSCSHYDAGGGGWPGEEEKRRTSRGLMIGDTHSEARVGFCLQAMEALNCE